MVGLLEVDLHGRRVGKLEQREIVEVALSHPAAVDGDLLEKLAQAVDDRALLLVQGAGRVDDRVAHVPDHPDLVDLEPARRVDAHLGHLGEVAPVAEVEAHPHPAALGKGAASPARLLGHQLQHAAHAGGVVGRLAVGVAHDARGPEQLEAELDGVPAGREGQLVDEGLEDESEGVAAGGPPSGMCVASSRKWERKRAGNSLSEMPELLANLSPSPKVTKWSRQATSLPSASTPPFRKWKPPGR